MKRQVRCGVFETNSSSTHSIAIPKNVHIPSHVSFHIDEFGWEWNEANAADYLYTAIYVTSRTESEAKEKIAKLKSILNERGISYHFGRAKTSVERYENRDYFYLDNGYIDHGYELGSFVNELLNDGDKLIRFISGGMVFTGNDNCSTEQGGFVERAEKYLSCYDWDAGTSYRIANPYYMSNHEDYEWYYKGN